MSVTLAGLAARLADRVRRVMPAGGRRDRLTADLESSFAGVRTPVDEAGCLAVQARAQRHARHLELHFHPGREAAADDEAGGWPPPDPVRVRAQAAGVAQVRRHGECWTLRLDALAPLSLAAPYVEAAFTLAAGASRRGPVLSIMATPRRSPGFVSQVGRAVGYRGCIRPFGPRREAEAGPVAGRHDRQDRP